MVQRTCEANAASRNSPFIFTICIKSIEPYYFKLAYVVLHVAIKQFFHAHTHTHTSKNGEVSRFTRSLLMESFQLTLKFHPFIPSNKKSKQRILI